MSSLRTVSDVFEHTSTLMGIVVHPLARSDSASDTIKSVVRSSRSCGCLTITAITREFSAKFSTMIATIINGLTSSNSKSLMLEHDSEFQSDSLTCDTSALCLNNAHSYNDRCLELSHTD